MRIHHTKLSSFYTHVSSGPIIEDCDGLRFGIYNIKYKELDNDWLNSKLNREKNYWNDVKDFKWIKLQHSPHWEEISQSLIYPESLLPDIIKVTIKNDDEI